MQRLLPSSVAVGALLLIPACGATGTVPAPPPGSPALVEAPASPPEIAARPGSPCAPGRWRDLLSAEPGVEGDGELEALARLAQRQLEADPRGAAALVAEGLRRSPADDPEGYRWLLRLTADLEETGALDPECQAILDAGFGDAEATCEAQGSMWGLTVTMPPDREREQTCRSVACARCNRALGRVRVRFGDRSAAVGADVSELLAESLEYEALVFGDGAPCPFSLHAAEMSLILAGRTGDEARTRELARRVEERFPTHVIYLVHRDIVSRGGPPDPCAPPPGSWLLRLDEPPPLRRRFDQRTR